MKVALPVVLGLHGSQTEGTTRRFKVGDFKTEWSRRIANRHQNRHFSDLPG